jgi:hypothetical protein
MRAFSSWKTASLFGNNVWIMGRAWLPNLSTYSLEVIRPWRVIMRPIEYCHDFECCDYRGGMNWWMELLTTCIHHSELHFTDHWHTHTD